MTTKPRTNARFTGDLSRDMLRHIRDSGLTAYELGKRSGVQASVLQRFMNGERELRLSTAGKVCKVLGLRLEKRKNATE